jgi:uncharacterized CHY-type Zn-finger protein
MKLEYLICDKCLHLLTAAHFNNSTICHSCTRSSKENK